MYDDNTGKRKVSNQTTTVLEESKDVTNEQQESSLKKQKRLLSIPDAVSMTIEDTRVCDEKSMEMDVTEDETTRKDEATSSGCVSADVMKDMSRGGVDLSNPVVNCEWKPLEKELYVKGLEIFGRNRYMIIVCEALMSGLLFEVV